MTFSKSLPQHGSKICNWLKFADGKEGQFDFICAAKLGSFVIGRSLSKVETAKRFLNFANLTAFTPAAPQLLDFGVNS